LTIDRVKGLRVDGKGRYHLDLYGPGPKDHARVLVDGWSGEILAAKLKDAERDFPE
jgi:hypothetical protein